VSLLVEVLSTAYERTTTEQLDALADDFERGL
jgi:hypothetical protein